MSGLSLLCRNNIKWKACRLPLMPCREEKLLWLHLLDRKGQTGKSSSHHFVILNASKCKTLVNLCFFFPLELKGISGRRCWPTFTSRLLQTIFSVAGQDIVVLQDTNLILDTPGLWIIVYLFSRVWRGKWDTYVKLQNISQQGCFKAKIEAEVVFCKFALCICCIHLNQPGLWI